MSDAEKHNENVSKGLKRFYELGGSIVVGPLVRERDLPNDIKHSSNNRYIHRIKWIYRV